MVSRRNYFSIVLIMLVIFFLFQGTLAMRERWNNYNNNEYVIRTSLDHNSQWHQDPSASADTSDRYAVYIGDENCATAKVAREWALYTKRDLFFYPSLAEYNPSENKPEVILLEGTDIDELSEVAKILSLINRSGCNFIFMDIPDVATLKSLNGIRDILGINQIREDNVTIEGVHLFDGFLLGGEIVYKAEREEDRKRQDLDLEVPWLVTLDGTKTYMVGMMEADEDDPSQNEYLPALIWRRSMGSQRVFAVNGDYMHNALSGIGLLDAMMAEMKEYEIYPVIDAQNLVLNAFPFATNENTEEIEKRYGRDLIHMQYDIILPTLTTAVNEAGFKLTSFFLSGYGNDSAQADTEILDSYLREMKELDSEMGVSFVHAGDVDFDSQVRRQTEYLEAQDTSYDWNAGYLMPEDKEILNSAVTDGLIAQIAAFTSDYDADENIVSYTQGGKTIQTITSLANHHTYADDIRLRGLETALAYSTIEVDMIQAFYPASKEDEWQKLSETIMADIMTYWKPFSDFKRTTLSQSDYRVRSFLNLDFSESRSDNTITLNNRSGGYAAYYMLRTHNENITSVENGEFRQIEKNAYLIYTNAEQALIHLERIDNK